MLVAAEAGYQLEECTGFGCYVLYPACPHMRMQYNTEAMLLCHSGGKPRVVKRHGLVYEDRPDGLTRLELVRGLSNMQGQHNCFLNVIIQSLWHLPAFRTALLNLPTALSDNGASSKDTAVAQALHNVFAAFSQSPPEAQMAAALRDVDVQSASTGSPPAQQLQQQERVESSGSAAASADADADAVRQSISPDELREAMSQLEKGQTPIKFDLSEMHDAAEVSVLPYSLCIRL